MFIVEVVVNPPVIAKVLPSKVRFPSPLNVSALSAVNTLLLAPLTKRLLLKIFALVNEVPPGSLVCCVVVDSS